MPSLSDPEIRVLACLVEKEAAVPDSYPLSLNALRLACNQATNRRPVVAFDDRTVEAALLSLKSMGLVRFVHPSHGGRTIRYRHVADERWHLSPGETQVLAALALRGPQTTNEVTSRVERLVPADERGQTEAMLDTLAARSPEAFARRLERRAGDREARWVATLGPTDHETLGDAAGPAPTDDAHEEASSAADAPSPAHADGAATARVGGAVPGVELDVTRAEVAALAERVEQLGAVIGAVAARMERLERELGLDQS